MKGLSVSPVDEPSIRSFLAKPYLVGSYFWTPSDILQQHIISYDTAGVTSIPIWQNKLYGYNLFRGTLCAKVVINAQPFQQGRLLIHVLPFINAQPLSWLSMHGVDITQMTQHPSVEMDCRDTSCELEIPWVGPTPWMSARGTGLDWGRIHVTVLCPQSTGASGSAGIEVQLFLSIKDAEFAAPIVPQSGDRKRTVRFNKKLSAEAEQDAISEGKPISKALALASRAAEVAKGIPMLSSLAAPAAWVLRSSSNLASAFGWSKPNLTTPPMFVITRPFHNFGNASGTSQSEPLSIDADPMVSILPGFAGSDVDEMSWNYIKSIPAYLENFSFTTSSVVAATLYKKAIGPLLLYNQYDNGLASPNLAVFRSFPPFGHVANAFGRYRGGIKMILKFVKTDFHSGRILITWSPNPSLAVDPTLATSAYSMRTIVDIREVTEVEITLPYMLKGAWQQSDLDMGTVQISVLNTLQAPPTCATAIQVLVYYAAAEDFDLAVVNNRSLTPYSPQSGDKPNTKAVGVIGNDSSTIPMVEEYSVGEKFTSLKQLISRYSRMYFNSATMDTTVAFRMYPWSTGVFRGGLISTATGAAMGDFYSFISAGFALARGGMRYSINSSNSVFTQIDFSRQAFDLMEAGSSSTLQLAGTTLATGFANGSAAVSNLWVKPGVSGATGTLTTANPAIFVQSPNGVDVLLPQYTNNPSRLIVLDSDGTKISTNYSYDLVPFMALQYSQNSSTITNKAIYRAAAEDAQLGYFIGFGPLLVQVT
nr:MAG: hypothetical protein 2 [Dicistroviridae sp.]